MDIPKQNLNKDFKDGFTSGYTRAGNIGVERARHEANTKLAMIDPKYDWMDTYTFVYWTAYRRGVARLAAEEVARRAEKEVSTE